MADYYELLGVDEDAPVDDIRTAYRDKKAAVDREREGQGHRPGQGRGRRAEQGVERALRPVPARPLRRRSAPTPTVVDDDEDDDEDGRARRGAASKPAEAPGSGRPRPSAARRAASAQPTVTLPAGLHFPTTKRRLVAMGIDLAVLIVLFIGSQLLVRAAREVATTRPRTTACSAADQARDPRRADDATKKAKAAASAERRRAQDRRRARTRRTATPRPAEKKLNDELTAQQKVLAPTQNLVSGIFFLTALLILLIPSMFGGQTLGKRLQHVRVVRVDGNPLRWPTCSAATRALVFAAYVLSTFLRSPDRCAASSCSWRRCGPATPTSRRLQDQFAKTLVLTDIEE